MKLKFLNLALIIMLSTSFVTEASADFLSLAINLQYSSQVPDSTNKFVEGTELLGNGMYVVVGAFRNYNNAVNYTKHVSAKGYDTNYGVRSDKDYYYVYLYRTADWENAVEETYRVREDEELNEAWVMRVINDTSIKVAESDLERAKEAISNNEPVVDPVASEENFEDSSADDDVAPPTEVTEEVVEEPIEEEVVTSNEVKKEDLKGDYFLLLNAYRFQDKKPVQANIQLIDNERAKLIRQLKSNELQGVWDPRNGTSSVKLICDVFGYRKLEHNLLLKSPMSDSTKNFVKIEDDIITVDFKLERLKPGDIAVMYNVYFFNDAAIMRPESKYEINSLLEMMKENENLKIKIHGHTNGGKPGKIVKMGEGAKNYFSIASTNTEGFGSAKDLSKERAELMKTYLIEQGIDANRMDVKGWGGKKMLYDKDSPQAKKNIRVEVEILQD